MRLYLFHAENFVYQKVGDSFDGTCDFKIFTPANIGSYGIPEGLDAFDGLTIFIKVSQFEVVSPEPFLYTEHLISIYTSCTAIYEDQFLVLQVYTCLDFINPSSSSPLSLNDLHIHAETAWRH